MKDITESLEGINETDRVYECDNGKYVKVRVLKETPPPGSASFGVAFLRVSGAETGSDGRALPHGDGYRIAPAEIRTVMYDQTVKFVELVDSIRKECVERTLQASEMQEQIDATLS